MNERLSSLRRLPGAGRVLRALGVGGVPAGGYFGAGWSLGTLLRLYWLETILVTLVVATLVVRHRRVTRKAGHWNAESAVTTSGRGGKSSRSRKTTLLEAFRSEGEVPGGVRALGRRLPKKEGRSFSEHYAAEIAAQRARIEKNEEVRPHPQMPG